VFFELAMNLGRFRAMLEMRPEVVVELLRLTWESGSDRWIEFYGKEFFEHAMHHGPFREMLEMRPEVVVEWLRLARESGSDCYCWIERYGEELFGHAIRSNLSRMPLESVRDIEWYAEITRNDLLMNEIQTYVGGAANR
jgi:hypothetical protein